MRIVSITSVLLFSTLFLAGCGLGSAVKAGYNMIATPSINECYQLKGKTLAQVEETFGKPEGAMTLVDKNRYQLTYKKGAMTLVVEANDIQPDEKVISIDCHKN